jgi:hypothetical protein
LKVLLNTHPETIVDRVPLSTLNKNLGVIAMVHSPFEWPSSGFFVSAASMVSLSIKPTAFSTSDDVAGLNPNDRQCNYDVSEPKKRFSINLKKFPARSEAVQLDAPRRFALHEIQLHVGMSPGA